jgi:hypothetical protein
VTPSELRARRRALTAQASALQALPLATRAAAISETARRLRDPRNAHGSGLRAALAQCSGLSAPNVELGIATTLGLFEADAITALVEGRPGVSARQPCVVVLAGNVWSAATRPLLLPLACGVPVMAKAASRDDALPHALAAALREVDPVLGAALEVVTFERERSELFEALLENAQLVSVYGDDATLATFEARLPPGSQLLRHGHGIGIACIGADAARTRLEAASLAGRLAHDVAAYDQRGCLSPHAVLVEAGGAVDAHTFAVLLADALEAVHAALPLGDDLDTAAASLQWRGVAAATGELFVREHGAVSFERDAAIRPSPGQRQIAVLACDDLPAMRARLAPLGPHLKALGLAGATVTTALADLAPYCCPLGQMQSPPLDAALDALHPLAGYRN